MKALKRLSSEKQAAQANRQGQRARRKHYYEFFDLDPWVEEQKIVLAKKRNIRSVDTTNSQTPTTTTTSVSKQPVKESEKSENVVVSTPSTEQPSKKVKVSQETTASTDKNKNKTTEETDVPNVKQQPKKGKSDKNRVYKNKEADEVHPSWAARQQQKTAAFSGTRVVFD